MAAAPLSRHSPVAMFDLPSTQDEDLSDREDQRLLSGDGEVHDLEADDSSSVSSAAPTSLDSSVAAASASAPAPATIPPNQKLLGPGSAYIVIISRVLGTGIFALPSHILRAAGTRTLALAIWLIGALLTYFAMQVYLELGCMLPRSGGEKTYLELAYRRPRWLASTVVAVWVVLGGVSSNNCVVFAKYLLSATTATASGGGGDGDGAGGAEPGGFAVKCIASLLLTAVVVAHGRFYSAALRVQNVLGMAKIGFLAFLILTSLYVVLRGPSSSSPHPDPSSRYVPTSSSDVSRAGDLPPEDYQPSWSVLSTAIFRVFYAYHGIENANNILGEVRDPARTLKLVAPLALITALVAYVLVNLAYFAVIPVEEIKASGDLVGLVFFQRVCGTGTGKLVLSLAVALSAMGNVMVVAFSMARMAQEVALQGFLPWGALLGSSKPWGTPLGGLLVHYIPSLLAIVLPPSATVYVLIADTKGYASQFIVLALCIGLFMLRRTHPSLERPYSAWPSAVIIRLVLCVALIVAPLFSSKAEKLISYQNMHVLLALAILGLSVTYWCVAFVLVPRLFGYEIEEEVSMLETGKQVTKLIRVHPGSFSARYPGDSA
ncbi:amino acid permease-domain-containing protein [Xylariales sp. PMI_506]|nr:amino acid permease-domain-containing protein [Xylariales sp. PMI_506]